MTDDREVDETIEVVHAAGVPPLTLRTRRKDGAEKREPLPSGDPRRMTDAKCAWRKMTPEQRSRFLLDVGAERTENDGIARSGRLGYWISMEATEQSRV